MRRPSKENTQKLVEFIDTVAEGREPEDWLAAFMIGPRVIVLFRIDGGEVH